MAFNRLSGLLWQSLAISVFRLQVSADRRIKLLRIAHHLPPVRGFEPSVLIGETSAVEIPDKRLLFRPRLARRRYFVVDTQSSYTFATVGPFDTEPRRKSVRYCVEDSPSKKRASEKLGKQHTLGVGADDYNSHTPHLCSKLTPPAWLSDRGSTARRSLAC